MSSREERIRKLAARLSPEAYPSAAKAKAAKRPRKTHSLYIDTALLRSVDDALARVQSEITPVELSKSAFLETLLRYGIEHLDDILATLKPPSHRP